MKYSCEFCEYEGYNIRSVLEHEAEHYLLTYCEYKTWQRLEHDYHNTVDDTVKADMADKLNKFIEEHPQLLTLPIPAHFYPENG